MRPKITPLADQGELVLKTLSDGEEVLYAHPKDADLARWLCSASTSTLDEFISAGSGAA